MERLKASMSAVETAIAKIDKIRANLDAARHRAEADIAALFGSEQALPQSPNKPRKTTTLISGNAGPTNGASTGPS